jgi:hypothetical protein
MLKITYNSWLWIVLSIPTFVEGAVNLLFPRLNGRAGLREEEAL